MKKYLSYILFIALMVSVFMTTSIVFARSPQIAGCDVFACDSIWNWPVDSLAVDSNSAAYIQFIGAADNVHADFGSGLWNGAPIGIPFIDVPTTQPTVDVTFNYYDESDPGPYPIPPDAPIEGGETSSGDRHVLVLDRDTCVLYELFSAYKNGDDSWSARSGAVFDLKSKNLRPEGWTSADAAGLPILPGLIRYEEVAAGKIRHAIRFTVSQTQRAYVWPARHFASSLTDEQSPPMGQRFRLKNDFDLSGFSYQPRVILEAMKSYGLILADNGSNWFISGVPDERWDNDQLHELHQVPGSAFEAVDTSELQSNPDTIQVRPSLGDVIRLLAVLTGQELPTIGCDIDGDARSGMAEAVRYLLLMAQ